MKKLTMIKFRGSPTVNVLHEVKILGYYFTIFANLNKLRNFVLQYQLLRNILAMNSNWLTSTELMQHTWLANIC